MDAKLKAKELINQFHYQICTDNGISENDSTELCAKQCALIAVNEIIENIKEWDFMNDNGEHHFWFWNKVKQEISTL